MVKCMEIPLYDLFTENCPRRKLGQCHWPPFQNFFVTYFSLLKPSQDPFPLLEEKNPELEAFLKN